jgi:hypothetical protein
MVLTRINPIHSSHCLVQEAELFSGHIRLQAQSKVIDPWMWAPLIRVVRPYFGRILRWESLTFANTQLSRGRIHGTLKNYNSLSDDVLAVISVPKEFCRSSGRVYRHGSTSSGPLWATENPSRLAVS